MNSRGSDHGRFYWLTDEDASAARRILSVLGSSTVPGHQADIGSLEVGESPLTHSGRLLERAQVALALRKRRIDVLGQRFSSEAPFAILLALYVVDGRELIVTRVARSARLSTSSTLRWLEALLEQGWIERNGSPEDRRLGWITLTDEGREAMRRVLSLTDQVDLSAPQ